MTSEHAVPFNDLTRGATALWADCAPLWERTLAEGRVILGEAVTRFEKEFGAYIGGATATQAVGVGNGTDALELAMRTVGVGPTSTVLTAANAGYYASTAIVAIGAKPVYVDIRDDDVTPDAASIEAVLRQQRVDAVVVTHLYGRLATDIEAIVAVCRNLGVPLIEDCSQSHGARAGETMCGSFGDIAAFSFYPTKNLGALGDGGAIYSRTDEVGAVARSLRQYGWGDKYVVERAGGRNSRLDEVQAIALAVALRQLDDKNETRRSIIDRYREAAPSVEFLCCAAAREQWVGHLGVVACTDRDAARAHLTGRGIGTDVHFPVPDHLQPAQRSRGHSMLPNTERLSRQTLSVPCFPEMTENEIDQVCSALATVPR